jgi:probable F420-dependent oxidoreductase
MRIGVTFVNSLTGVAAEGAHALAEACESVGVESVWTVEHAVVPAGYSSEYPYSKTGRMPGGDTAPIADPLAWLAFVAARSSTLQLATGVLILPQRNPLILAKEAATLDVLSGGRLLLGVGAGWLEEEFQALGVPFADRGARMDDYILALRALWSEDETHEGDFVRFRDARSYPKPVNGTVPIVVGGHSLAAARRAGRLGDGFYPARHDRIDALLAAMRASATDAGRDPGEIELTTGASRDAERMRRLLDLGFTRFVLPPPIGAPEEIEGVLAAMVEPLPGLTGP